jgi:hypothetical protein
MAMKPKPLTLTNRAAQSLQGTNHSVFNPGLYKVMDTTGNEVQPGWNREPLTYVTVHAPTTVTKGWRAFFQPHGWWCLMDANMTREEAQETAERLMDVTNLRRSGA